MYLLASGESEDEVLNYMVTHSKVLKQALYMPISMFLEKNPNVRCEADVESVEGKIELYLNYEAEDQIYGLKQLIEMKDKEIFTLIWESEIMDERHFFIALNWIFDANWVEGIEYLINNERSQELYTSLYPSERVYFYERMRTFLDSKLDFEEGKISEEAVLEDIRNNVENLRNCISDCEEDVKLFLKSLLSGLTKKPYASVSILEIFKYFELFDILVKGREIEIIKFGDHIYNVISLPSKIYPIAKEFNILMEHKESRRKKYFTIIDKYDYFVSNPKLSNLNPAKTFYAIRAHNLSTFTALIEKSSLYWSQFITLRKSPPPPKKDYKLFDIGQRKMFEEENQEQMEIKQNDKVKKTGFTKWKPLHFAIYYGEKKMVSEILKASKYSSRKALTLENKKLKIGDDVYALEMCIR